MIAGVNSLVADETQRGSVAEPGPTVGKPIPETNPEARIPSPVSCDKLLMG
jgi:hypothetical protein